jgi:hypothetical protein
MKFDDRFLKKIKTWVEVLTQRVGPHPTRAVGCRPSMMAVTVTYYGLHG